MAHGRGERDIKALIACHKCESVIQLEFDFCPYCGVPQGEVQPVAAGEVSGPRETAEANAAPAAPELRQPRKSAETQRAPETNPAGKVPYGRLLMLAVMGCAAIAGLYAAGLLGDWNGRILGLYLMTIILLVVNPWNLRSRTPLLGSQSKVRAGVGWLALGAVALIPLGAFPGNLTALSFVPELTSMPTFAWQADNPAAATATPVPTPVPTPTAVPSLLLVGNTDGSGAWLRGSPAMADRVRAWIDGTQMHVVGPDREAEGMTWRNVRDPAGNVGWVPVEYLVPPTPGPTPATATPSGYRQ